MLESKKGKKSFLQKIKEVRWIKNGKTSEELTSSDHLEFREYSILWIFLFTGYNFSWAVLIAFIGSIMLPEDIMFFVGDSTKQTVLGVVLGIIAFIQFIISPFIGNLSDRSPFLKIKNFEIGKKKIYVYLGTAIYCLSMVLRSFFKFKNTFCFIMYLIIATLGNAFSCMSLIAYTGLFADLFSKKQYNLVSAFLGLSQLLGAVVGIGLGFFFDIVEYHLLVIIIALIGLVSTAPICIFKEDLAVKNMEIRKKVKKEKEEKKKKKNEDFESSDTSPNSTLDEGMIDVPINTEQEAEATEKITSKQPIKPKSIEIIIKAFKYIFQFIKPFGNRNFFWAFTARFIFMFSIASLQSFLLYYLKDCIKTFDIFGISWIDGEEQAISVIGIVVLIGGLISAIIGPVFAGLIGRKWIICIAGLMMCIASFGLIILQKFIFTILFCIPFGLGMGAFYSVDMALVNAVLPDMNESSKDLAIFSIASVLPFAVATPLGGLLISFGNGLYTNGKIQIENFGYFLLFGVSIFVQIAGSVSVLFIKEKRKTKNEKFQELLDELEGDVFEEENFQFDIPLDEEEEGHAE